MEDFASDIMLAVPDAPSPAPPVAQDDTACTWLLAACPPAPPPTPGGIDHTAAELRRLFDAANERLYEGRLPLPQITIQSRGRHQAYGWCTVSPLWTGGGVQRWEINLSAEYLDRGVSAAAETLLHEMVHLWHLCQVPSIVDCTSNQYHNERFRAGAEAHGLTCERIPTYGWARTALAPATTAWLDTVGLDATAFAIARRTATAGVSPPPPPTAREGGTPRGTSDGTAGKLKRWSCGCTNIRAAVTVQAICTACGHEFVLGARAERPGPTPVGSGV